MIMIDYQAEKTEQFEHFHGKQTARLGERTANERESKTKTLTFIRVHSRFKKCRK